MIAALWFFHGHGPDGAYETARAQAISVTVGGVLQLGWLMLACRQAGVSLAIKRPRIDDDVRQLLKLILPAALGAGAVQVNLAVSTALAGGLLDPGSISYIYYADRLNQLPLGLIGIGLGTILLPTVSRQLSQKRDAEAMDTQNRGVELALFLTLPATVAFVFASEPIIRGLFQHGAFHRDRQRSLQLGALGLLARPALLRAREGADPRLLRPRTTPRRRCATPIQSVGVNLVGNLILIPVLGRFGYGHVGPPLATALASTRQRLDALPHAAQARPFRGRSRNCAAACRASRSPSLIMGAVALLPRAADRSLSHRLDPSPRGAAWSRWSAPASLSTRSPAS